MSAPPPRALGIDFGERRIGVAATDALGIAAHPVEAIEARTRDAAADRVAEIARERAAEVLVFGLPVHMDGRAHEAAVAVRAFARRCAARTGLPVEYVDERLTTVEADRLLGAAGGGGRRRGAKGRVDMAAAAVLLRDWLELRTAGGPAAKKQGGGPDEG